MVVLDKTAEQAGEIASAFLREQEQVHEYVQSPSSVFSEGSYWHVVFQRVNDNFRPSVGIVTVDKQTGRAAWLPMR